jgi:hypothetical protein
MKQVIARSGVSNLKPYDLKASPRRRFVIGAFELKNLSHRIALNFLFLFRGEKEKKKYLNQTHS